MATEEAVDRASPAPTDNAGDKPDENVNDSYNFLYDNERPVIVLLAIKFSPNANNNCSEVVSDMKVSSNVVE